MKKKIAADLTSLAHRILQLKNKEDLKELQVLARETYEKITLLRFAEEHLSELKPTAGLKEVMEKIEEVHEEAPLKETLVANETEIEKVVEPEEIEEPVFESNDLSDLFVPAEDDQREEMDLPGISTIQKMVVEMPDEIPNTPEFEKVEDETASNENKLNEAAAEEKPSWQKLIDKVQQEKSQAENADLFEKKVEEPVAKSVEEPVDVSEITPQPDYKKNDFDEITADFKEIPVFERKINDSAERPKSLNERLNQGMKIGMNDRLGFVKHLFNGNTDDFNRVLSQLNTLSTLEKANNFIDELVKPEYNNWEGKDAYEAKFKELVERNYS